MFRAKHLLTGLALSVAASGNIAQAPAEGRLHGPGFCRVAPVQRVP